MIRRLGAVALAIYAIIGLWYGTKHDNGLVGVTAMAAGIAAIFIGFYPPEDPDETDEQNDADLAASAGWTFVLSKSGLRLSCGNFVNADGVMNHRQYFSVISALAEAGQMLHQRMIGELNYRELVHQIAASGLPLEDKEPSVTVELW